MSFRANILCTESVAARGSLSNGEIFANFKAVEEGRLSWAGICCQLINSMFCQNCTCLEVHTSLSSLSVPPPAGTRIASCKPVTPQSSCTSAKEHPSSPSTSKLHHATKCRACDFPTRTTSHIAALIQPRRSRSQTPINGCLQSFPTSLGTSIAPIYVASHVSRAFPLSAHDGRGAGEKDKRDQGMASQVVLCAFA
jgi:hypothetical protein